MTDYYFRHAKYAAAKWHRRFLDRAYHRSYEALQRLGCCALERGDARILLCGVGAPATLLQFAAFVAERQPRAALVVVDIAPAAVAASKMAWQSIDTRLEATFVCADARGLPFADASFDLVETDFLLQFLPPGDRKVVLREWRRLLRPNGGFMTRDWVTGTRALDPLWNAIHRTALRAILGATTYELRCEELRRDADETEITALVQRLSRLPLIHVIAGVARR